MWKDDGDDDEDENDDCSFFSLLALGLHRMNVTLKDVLRLPEVQIIVKFE